MARYIHDDDEPTPSAREALSGLRELLFGSWGNAAVTVSFAILMASIFYASGIAVSAAQSMASIDPGMWAEIIAAGIACLIFARTLYSTKMRTFWMWSILISSAIAIVSVCLGAWWQVFTHNRLGGHELHLPHHADMALFGSIVLLSVTMGVKKWIGGETDVFVWTVMIFTMLSFMVILPMSVGA